MIKISIDNDGMYVIVYYRTNIIHLYSIDDVFYKSALIFCITGCTTFEVTGIYYHRMWDNDD